MDGKRGGKKKKRCKEADLLPDLHARGLQRGRNGETQSRGAPAAGIVLMELQLQGGRTLASPGTVGAPRALQRCTATVHPGGPVFGAVGCPGSWAGEGWEEAEMFSSAFRYIFAP